MSSLLTKPKDEYKAMFFKQIQKHGDNFSYIIADQQTKEAAVVDSSYNADEIVRVIKANGFQLKYVINTHGHSDHTAGNTELKAIFSAKTVGHEKARNSPDITVKDGDALSVGKIRIQIIFTPGHTPVSYTHLTLPTILRV